MNDIIKEIEIITKPHKVRFYYYRYLTLGKLSKREVSVLSEISKYGKVNNDNKQNLRFKLNMSKEHLNNIINKLKNLKILIGTRNDYVLEDEYIYNEEKIIKIKIIEE